MNSFLFGLMLMSMAIIAVTYIVKSKIDCADKGGMLVREFIGFECVKGEIL